MSAASAHVTCHALHKRFEEGPPVLDGISFSAAPRDFVSLLGPSGCGKSTLLRLIAGLTAPTSGRIEISGRTTREHRENLAFVFQEPALLPWLDVAANIGTQLLTLKFSRDDEIEADLVGLEMGARGGFDPRAAVTLWEKMGRASSSGGGPAFLSTHPTGPDRLRRLQYNIPRV